MHFRAGSYSGYNAWREWLAKTIHGVTPQTIWDNPDQYIGKPFYELIEFSDCEGTIGPKISAKLAEDFRNYFADIDSLDETDDVDCYKTKYRDWQKAFELAANTGAVCFH